MLGSAMFTTERSRTIMSWAQSMTARVMPGRWRRRAAARRPEGWTEADETDDDRAEEGMGPSRTRVEESAGRAEGSPGLSIRRAGRATVGCGRPLRLLYGGSLRFAT